MEWHPRRGARGGDEDPAAGSSARSMLGRIVVLESLRRRVVLRDANGTDLGEIDDDLVTVAHGTQKGLSFRQIEFEFGRGSPARGP